MNLKNHKSKTKIKFKFKKMTKSIFTLLAFISISITAFSQDVITQKSGEDIQAKILEVNQTDVKYKKFDNQNGPTFTLLKSEVIMIKYENGTNDYFNKNLVALDNEMLKISRENPILLTKKGNKVFVEILDEASRAGEQYFIEALKEWGYWNIVNNKNEAHFIIVFNIDKKAMLDKSANVIFKTREEKEFKKSDSYRASTSAFNGYNAFRAVANKIVEKYFRKEFK